VRDDRIEITFSNVGQGLICRGDHLEGFAISGADGKFINADAEIVGQRVVVVHSPQITHPQSVRFGWADYPVVNLWNTDGLPASPFRTDSPN
jgi:sialate O-acetylesterase